MPLCSFNVSKAKEVLVLDKNGALISILIPADLEFDSFCLVKKQ